MEKINFNDIYNLPDFVGYGEIFVLYGVGGHGEYIYNALDKHGIYPAEICDSHKVGEEFHGYKVRDINEVAEKYHNPKILIASTVYYDEIKERVLELFDEKCLIPYPDFYSIVFKEFIKEHQIELDEVYKLLFDDESKRIFTEVLKSRSSPDYDTFKDIQTDNQYFVEDIVCLTDKECFVDCGAFTGDTLDDFIRHTSNQFEKVYCFEPSEDTFKELTKAWRKHGEDERIVLKNSGVYHESTEIGFVDNYLAVGNSIDVKSTDLINVVSIDEFVKEAVTYIKMDVEGAELAALNGAKETILKNKPQLAISIYHKDEDFIEIPRFIAELNLGYRFYLRHHSNCKLETILYAVL